MFELSILLGWCATLIQLFYRFFGELLVSSHDNAPVSHQHITNPVTAIADAQGYLSVLGDFGLTVVACGQLRTKVWKNWYRARMIHEVTILFKFPVFYLDFFFVSNLFASDQKC